jgi:hypothetical protein
VVVNFFDTVSRYDLLKGTARCCFFTEAKHDHRYSYFKLKHDYSLTTVPYRYLPVPVRKPRYRRLLVVSDAAMPYFYKQSYIDTRTSS